MIVTTTSFSYALRHPALRSLFPATGPEDHEKEHDSQLEGSDDEQTRSLSRKLCAATAPHNQPANSVVVPAKGSQVGCVQAGAEGLGAKVRRRQLDPPLEAKKPDTRPKRRPRR